MSRLLVQEVVELQEVEEGGESGLDPGLREYNKAAAAAAVDKVANDMIFEMRTQVHAHTCIHPNRISDIITRQLCMNPKKTRLSVQTPCSRDTFILLFSEHGFDRRETSKLGERFHVKIEAPNSTDQFVGIMGDDYAPSMRRFHGRDAQGNWSTTIVDPDVGIKLVWSRQTRKSKTPTGHRVEEKEIVTVQFGICTCVLAHKDIREVVTEEESKESRPKVFELDDLEKKLLEAKEQAGIRKRKISDLENRVNLWKSRYKEQVKMTSRYKDAWAKSAKAYKLLLEKHNKARSAHFRVMSVPKVD